MLMRTLCIKFSGLNPDMDLKARKRDDSLIKHSFARYLTEIGSEKWAFMYSTALAILE